MDKPEVREIYEQIFAGPAPALHPWDVQLQFICKQLPKDFSAPILDAGCGDGRYAAHLAQLGYQNVDAIDLFEKVDTAGVHYRQASIDATGFDDDSFDFIFSNSVIYHLDEPENGIRELRRVLRSGGTLLLTAHTKYSLYTYWRQLKLKLGLPSVRHLEGVKFYSAGDYQRMMRRQGLEMVWVDGYWGSVYLVPLYRMLTATIRRRLGRPPAAGRRRMPHSGPIARFMATAGYHSVLAARKP